MKIGGCDYSSKAIDIVFLDLDDRVQPEWHRFTLTGTDAFQRTRSVAEVMPPRTSVLWDECLALGIEHPGGSHGTGAMLRVQGAVLSMLPKDLLVQPWPPAAWRKSCGLKGNAPKAAVLDWANRHRSDREPAVIVWPQDACDAFCIALATRQAIHVGAAA